ncbi:MAG: hypothetical protein JWP73_82, partial [Phenylobacterium sp.]|nr:hypothetical protein [Phenylobacterium sp.]
MPQQYYLEIPGLHGSSVDQGYVGAFTVTSFSFAADEPVFPTSGGLGVGKPTFGPLQVTVADATGLADLMRGLAKGSMLPGASLIGVDNPGLHTVETYRVNLANVTVSSIEQTQDNGYVVTLNYGTIGVITHDLKPDGTAINPPATFGFDVITNVTVAAPPNVTPGSGAGPIAPTKFFLLINGVNGGSQDAAHQGWFEINSFDFAA